MSEENKYELTNNIRPANDFYEHQKVGENTEFTNEKGEFLQKRGSEKPHQFSFGSSNQEKKFTFGELNTIFDFIPTKFDGTLEENKKEFLALYERMHTDKELLDRLEKHMEIGRQEEEAIKNRPAGTSIHDAIKNISWKTNSEHNAVSGGGMVPKWLSGWLPSKLEHTLNQYPKGIYYDTHEKNFSHFFEGAKNAYKAAHAAAIDAALRGELEKAQKMEGLAQHYLDDMFSAGHLRTPRTALSGSWTKTFFAKYMHDDDKQLSVKNNFGEWIMQGDGDLLDGNKDNLEVLLTTKNQGLADLYKAYEYGKAKSFEKNGNETEEYKEAIKSPEKYKAYIEKLAKEHTDDKNTFKIDDYLPRPTEKNSTPLFRLDNNGKLEFRKKFWDSNSKDYTKTDDMMYGSLPLHLLAYLTHRFFFTKKEDLSYKSSRLYQEALKVDVEFDSQQGFTKGQTKIAIDFIPYFNALEHFKEACKNDINENTDEGKKINELIIEMENNFSDNLIKDKVTDEDKAKFIFNHNVLSNKLYDLLPKDSMLSTFLNKLSQVLANMGFSVEKRSVFDNVFQKNTILKESIKNVMIELVNEKRSNENNIDSKKTSISYTEETNNYQPLFHAIEQKFQNIYTNMKNSCSSYNH